MTEAAATDARADRGFTMVELLVVMVVIVILASIAIPIFMHNRAKAVDASIKSDLHTVAEAQETAYVDTHTYFTALPPDVPVSQDNVITVSLSSSESADAYCLVGQNPAGTQDWVFLSNQGGLQDRSVHACPAGF